MMHRIRFCWMCLMLFASILIGGCQSPADKLITQNSDNVIIDSPKGQIVLTPLSDYSIEAKYEVEGYSNAPSYALTNDITPVEASFSSKENYWEYATNYMSVRIDKETFALSYFADDKLILSEEEGLLYTDSIKGFRMNLSPDEKLMGGGERVLGMDRRGKRLHLYNRASYGYETHADLMYYSMPIVISSNKYMLLFDNAADGYLDLGATEENILQFEAVGGRLAYVVVASDSWKDLTNKYTEVTGHQPMPPRWALGNITSRMGYRSQKQVEKVVDTYRKEDFPLDALVLDLYWFGPDLQGHMGNLEWDKKAFPEPEQMMQNIKEKGVKTVLITEPFILKESGKYKETAEQNLLGTDINGEPYIFDFFFGTTALIDIFKPEAQKWFWGIYKKHTASGVEGWWGDLGEPEVHPDDLQHVNGSANTVHNAYGHEWAKTVYDGYAQDFPNKRPVILMRAGFAGSQRYGMIPWTGDVNRTWGGLKPQVEISLQMGMQGMAYMHSDLGGFAGNYKDSELYTRWLQYGVFQPVYRTHAQEDVPPEPIYWDEKTKDITRRYIKLRYALTPYLYTMAYKNSTEGTPLMQPLFYVDDNPELLNEKDTYLWGDNFVVSPVTDKGASEWTLPLPSNANWYNFFTGEKFVGGQEVTIPVDIHNIPVFVKGGSFIPMAPVVNSMDDYSTQKLNLHYYFDEDIASSEDFMYEDDGESNHSWENNQFEKLFFSSKFNHQNGLIIKIHPKGFDYKNKPESRDIQLIIHHHRTQPNYVKVDGEEVDFDWNEISKEIKVALTVSNSKLSVEIK
ncbi:glycoside hydrolase family 31 protein [Saccharicrinis aurantiacus]|uniref:glycoside hydrolase family 31 protein n=1 Tax=Saccharicrinis aurantiacus TaxID=1849719 RepID=UPI0009F95052|nr:TIM-barrel domain-containing protein [Saccharicrinis aurantiacus]